MQIHQSFVAYTRQTSGRLVHLCRGNATDVCPQWMWACSQRYGFCHTRSTLVLLLDIGARAQHVFYDRQVPIRVCRDPIGACNTNQRVSATIRCWTRPARVYLKRDSLPASPVVVKCGGAVIRCASVEVLGEYYFLEDSCTIFRHWLEIEASPAGATQPLDGIQDSRYSAWGSRSG
jgi:hypothetical protein